MSRSRDLDLAFERSQRDAFWLPPWATLVSEPGLCFWHSERPQSMLNTGVSLRGPSRRDSLARVQARFAGKPSQWNLGEPSLYRGVEEELRAFGWVPGPHYTLRVLDTSTPLPTSEEIRVLPVTDRATLVDAIHTQQQGFGGPTTDIADDRVRDELAACTGPGARVHRFIAYIDGQPVSYGGMNHYPHLDLVFLWGGCTLPSARGRGAYRAVLSARLERARALGAQVAGLYARHDTSDPIVAAMGFEAHGAMRQFISRP